MTMFDDEDKAAITEAFEEVRKDNAISITIRRAGATLAAQSVRLGQAGRYARGAQDAQFDEAKAPAILMAAADADVQVGDRFTYRGQVYVVQTVRPDTRFGLFADLETSQG